MNRWSCLLVMAAQSAWNRRSTLILVILSMALAATLLLGLERIRRQVRESFVQSVSGADLVVGARGGGLQLMLYAIFHLGGAANNISWDSAKKISALDDVAWTIPISLGDSHRSYPVVGAGLNFFEHYRYRQTEKPELSRGRAFNDVFEAVIGSEVARKLNYEAGSRITLSHGAVAEHAIEHADKPFEVVGILKATGTPVDRSLYISLEAMEAIHIDWRGGAPIPGVSIRPDQVKKFDLTPKSITALLVGLEKRGRVFAVQREINGWRDEPLTAVMPGVAMDQLWSIVGSGEKALWAVSILVTITSLAGLVSAVLAGLGERRRELAILRSTGAGPADIIILLSLEGMLITFVGTGIGLGLLATVICFLSPFLLDSYGLAVQLSPPARNELLILGGLILAGFLASLIPAFKAYRLSLSDGLSLSV